MQTAQTISKISIADPKKFIEIFKFYNKCNNNKEIRLFLDNDKISFKNINYGNTLLTNVEFLSSNFTEYNAKKCHKDLYLNILLDFLRRVNTKSDFLSIEFNDTDYYITIKNSVLRQFSSKIVELDIKEQKMPDLSHKAKIRITSKQLYDVFKDVKGIETVKFTVEDKKLFIQFLDFDGKTKDKEIREDGYNSIETTEKVISKFSFELLKNAVTKNLSEDVVLLLSNDYPLLMKYLEVDRYKVEIILAPKVDDDDIKTKDKEYHKEVEQKAREAVDINRNERLKKEPIKAKKHNKTRQKASKSDKRIDLMLLDDVDSDFIKFSKKYSTPLGDIRDIIEENYNKNNTEFMQFCLDRGLLDELNNAIEKFIKKRLGYYYGQFRKNI